MKLGGSFLLADGKANTQEFAQTAHCVQELVKDGFRVAVVVGGGSVARTYINAAEALGCNNGVKDHFGILVSRLNSRLFIEAIGSEYAFSEPPESLSALRQALQTRPVVVLGGLQPGQSTTAVAALCAEFLSAERVRILSKLNSLDAYE